RTRELAARHLAGEPAAPALQDAFVGELNTLLRTRTLGEEPNFPRTPLRAETIALLASKPAADNLIRLNRFLLEDAFGTELKPSRGLNAGLYRWAVFWGNRNTALLLGALIALVVLVRQKKELTLARVWELIESPLATAGVIILITSAGGAFGLMLKHAGVGEAVKTLVEGRALNLVLLAWTVSAVIRVAQGSATVAMLTTAAMIYPIMTGGPT